MRTRKIRKSSGGRLVAKKKIVNRHHNIYPSEDHPEQEWIEVLGKGEHLAYSRLCWYTRKHISKGLIRTLEFFILRNKDRAKDLEE